MIQWPMLRWYTDNCLRADETHENLGYQMLGSNARTLYCQEVHTTTPVCNCCVVFRISGVPRNFFSGGGGQQIQLRAEGTGIWGAVAPLSGVPLNLQMSETRVLIRLLRMYFPRNREFSSAFSKLRNFGGRSWTPLPLPLGTPLFRIGDFLIMRQEYLTK
jgi:hypothetical protein